MKKYCPSIYQTLRRKTRAVRVGSLFVGGDNPVRIQSMTTSSTHDVAATADQVMRLADAGCEIARVTVQGMREADACEGIKNTLIQKGYTIPLVADIHFFPPAAMRVIDFVDKVRVNPGNFVDPRASFKSIEYDDATYALEIARIEEKFGPLVEKCKKLGKSMRIGTNHGSLSDRIMNRYGDTSFGMVESAIEFARVCRKLGFHEMIFSMKASSPVVMLQAYRMLVAKMDELSLEESEPWNYPLHLGVTEAGDGEDGRVKSAVGMGALLLDGLGDTVRISLTEDPWHEIDPCKRLVRYANSCQNRGIAPFTESHRNIEAISRRVPLIPEKSLLHRDGTVILKIEPKDLDDPELLQKIGCKNGRKEVGTADALYINELSASHPMIEKLKTIGVSVVTTRPAIPGTLHLQSLASAEDGARAVYLNLEDESSWERISQIQPEMIFIIGKEARLHRARKFYEWMQNHFIESALILAFDYSAKAEDLVIEAAAEMGALLADGIGEGVAIRASLPVQTLHSLSFTLLQAVRMRTSKTEFISCPSCGRTLFNLQDVTARIKSRTAHLPGVKIAIMGCIVNGPGEMGEADFGYVGSKTGKVDLYVGKQCVEKGIDSLEADDRLIDLIKAHGRWVDKEADLALSLS